MTHLGVMVERNHAELIKIGVHLTHSKDKAHDLIAETFLHLDKVKREVPSDDKEFKIFFYRCMYNVMRAEYLGFNKLLNPKFDYKNEWEEPEEQSENIENFSSEIVSFKEGLSQLDRTLFELIFEENLSYRKIAKIYQELTGVPIRPKTIFVLAKEIKVKIKLKWKQ